MDSAELTPAPIGTKLWLVADLSGNGIPSGSVSAAAIQDMLNGTGDDRRFWDPDTSKPDTVDGILLGDQVGKFKVTGIHVPDAFATARIGLVLWKDANSNSTIGDAGDTFGYFDFGVVTPPAVGSALFVVDSNVHADDNLIVPVPEPAQGAILMALLCCGGTLAARRLRRTDRSARQLVEK
jgi:hypothetical protein